MIDHTYYTNLARGVLGRTTLTRISDLEKEDFVYIADQTLDDLGAVVLTPSWCLDNGVQSVNYFRSSFSDYGIFGVFGGATLHIDNYAVTIIQGDGDSVVHYFAIHPNEHGEHLYGLCETDTPVALITEDRRKGFDHVIRDEKVRQDIQELLEL